MRRYFCWGEEKIITEDFLGEYMETLSGKINK